MRAFFILLVIGFMSNDLINAQPLIRFSGLKIFVNDLESAEQFYCRVLGFKMEERNGREMRLSTNSFPLILEKVPFRNQDGPGSVRTVLSIQVSKLLPSIDSLRQQGVVFSDTLLARNGVGISVPFEDPSGNLLSLIEVQIVDVPRFEGFRIYNCGVNVTKMEDALNFYETTLGFKEWSKNYLPAAMPLKHVQDDSFAFMIHYKNGLKPSANKRGRNAQFSLVLEVNDPDAIKEYFASGGIEYEDQEDHLVCRDPSGNYVEILFKSD